MTRNLFVVNTPLQLLTAYIIANSEFAKMDNHLLVVNPNWDLVSSSYYINKIITDFSTWSQATTLQYWLHTVKINEIRDDINKMGTILQSVNNIDRVFLGSDKNIYNQLIVELSGNTHYYRIEDGVWSYTCPDRRWLSKQWHTIRIAFLRKIANLHSDMHYNVGGLGHGKAALADYLYKPDLLKRPSPLKVPIQRDAIIQSMEKIINHDDGYENQIIDNSVLFLGSMQAEYGLVSRQNELELLRDINQICKFNGLHLLYKPHPAESNEKLKYYQSELPEIQLCLIRDPIEIIYARLNTIKCVLAHSSSGLLFADMFAQRKIKPIALFKLYGDQKDSIPLNRLLEKGGANIPRSKQELAALLQ